MPKSFLRSVCRAIREPRARLVKLAACASDANVFLCALPAGTSTKEGKEDKHQFVEKFWFLMAVSWQGEALLSLVHQLNGLLHWQMFHRQLT
jgi:hypothetical protein